MKWPIEWFCLALGQLFMRPWSQAACASVHECGVPLTRMKAKFCAVFRWKGAIAPGAALLAVGCTQIERPLTLAESATGAGKGSPKPRTPLSVPK